jgi:uncharacterized surface anchored protein
MEHVDFGRKVFSFGDGNSVLKSTVVTEKARTEEGEVAFKQRLLHKYHGREGTIEIVFKRGRPDYAIITFVDSA